MPPHCDSLDGPVVTAARGALDANDVRVALAYIPQDGEEEVRRAFDAVARIRDQGPAIREVADRYLFETLVRVHRAGEGAPFTGLKPAGLDHGPVIPVAEQAIASGSPERLIVLLSGRLDEEIRMRFEHVMQLKASANGDLEAPYKARRLRDEEETDTGGILSEQRDEDGPIALERAGWEALSAGGQAARAFYERVLDQRALMLLPGGMVLDRRADIIDSMAGPPWSSYALDDVRCTALTGDTAVVTYAAEARREGQATYSALMSSLYVRRRDGWRLALHQQTPR